MNLTNRNIVLATPGRHQAGTPGLYLYVSKDAQVRRWIFRYTSPVTRRPNETGLGLVPVVTLADARDKALELRRQIARGIDPIQAKRAERNAGTTFAEVADAFIATHSPSWGVSQQLNAKHLLHGHGKLLARVPVSQITTAMMQAALRDLWFRAPNQARRTLKIWERVFDYAKAKDYRDGDNPAAWKANMEYRFPRRRAAEYKHFAAMPYEQVPTFIAALRQKQKYTSAVALEFLILTATRTGEVRNMQWAEVDWEQKLWIIPAPRTKTAKQHRVPLSDRAIELLALQKQRSVGSKFVFTGYSQAPLASQAMRLFLNHMGITDTVHGFRSTFRNWGLEQTEFDFFLLEMCLSHQVGNAVTRAYLRGDALDKRREIMEAWSQYCDYENK
jgi:integrase